MAWRMRATQFRAGAESMRWAIISESVVVWKVKPRLESSCRRGAELTILPLWPSTMVPAGASSFTWFATLVPVGTGGRIAVVADRYMPGEPTQDVLVKNLRNQAHPGVQPDTLSIAGRNTGAF